MRSPRNLLVGVLPQVILEVGVAQCPGPVASWHHAEVAASLPHQHSILGHFALVELPVLVLGPLGASYYVPTDGALHQTLEAAIDESLRTALQDVFIFLLICDFKINSCDL